MDSGAITGDYSTGFPSNNTASVAQSVNCGGSDPGSAATLACLRSVPLDTLLPAALAQAKSVAPPDGIDAYRPVIDGDFIPDQPSKLVLEGSFVKGKISRCALSRKIQTYLLAGISVVNAWMQDDGSSFVPPFVNSEAEVESFYGRSFSNSTLEQLLSLYPVEDFESQVTENSTFTAQYYRASRIYRDIHMTCPAINLTSEISLQSSAQTYLFTLNSTRFQPVWDAIGQPEYQIAHSSDVPYFFDVDIVGGDNSASALQLSAEVSRSFSAFASSGDPSTPDFDWPVAWKGQDRVDATVFVIGGPYGSGAAQLSLAGTSVADDERSEALAVEKLGERCAFIDSVTD